MRRHLLTEGNIDESKFNSFDALQLFEVGTTQALPTCGARVLEESRIALVPVIVANLLIFMVNMTSKQASRQAGKQANKQTKSMTTGILCDNHVVRFTAPGRCLFSEQANDTQSLSLTEIDDNNK
uniref:Uncharacterized protein n=1 Tax=Glossina austeni TaxID=7395 RepID=A0A1A9V7T2_GLOAU